jgi:hypothetical protein
VDDPSVTEEPSTSRSWSVTAILFAAIWAPLGLVVAAIRLGSSPRPKRALQRFGAIALAAAPGLALRETLDEPVVSLDLWYYAGLSTFELWLWRAAASFAAPLLGMVLAAWWLAYSADRTVASVTRIAARAAVPAILFALGWSLLVERDLPRLAGYLDSLPIVAEVPAADSTACRIRTEAEPVLTSCADRPADAGKLYRPEDHGGDPGLCVAISGGEPVLVDAFGMHAWSLRQDREANLHILHEQCRENNGIAISDSGALIELRKGMIFDRFHPDDLTFWLAVLGLTGGLLSMFFGLRAKRDAERFASARGGVLHADRTLEVDEAGPRPADVEADIPAGPVTLIAAKLDPQTYREPGRANARVLAGAPKQHAAAALDRARASASIALATLVLLGAPLVTHAVGALLAPSLRSGASPLPNGGTSAGRSVRPLRKDPSSFERAVMPELPQREPRAPKTLDSSGRDPFSPR